METISTRARMFLAKLNTMTIGDPEAQMSMHEVGQALGLDKNEAGQMAETLFMAGYAELKTLSGGIGITAQGLEELGVSPVVSEAASPDQTLGDKPVLEGPCLETVTRVLDDIKAALPDKGLSYDQLNETMTDIKTIEVQLLSCRPKTSVIREVFRSLGQALDVPGFSMIKSRLDQLISNH